MRMVINHIRFLSDDMLELCFKLSRPEPFFDTVIRNGRIIISGRKVIYGGVLYRMVSRNNKLEDK